jgi:hypothetical protein
MPKPILMILVLLTLFGVSARAQKSKTPRPPETPCDGVPIYSSAKMSEDKRQKVVALASSLIVIKRGRPATQEQKEAIKRTLIALADDDMKSEEALIERLANNLAKALSQGRKDDYARTEIAYALEVVLNVPLYLSSTGPAGSHIQIMYERIGIPEAAWVTMRDDLNAVRGKGIQKMDGRNGVN